MKLRLLVTEDTAKIVGVADAETGEPIEGVKRIDMDISDGEVHIVLDLDHVKLGHIKTVRE